MRPTTPTGLVTALTLAMLLPAGPAAAQGPQADPRIVIREHTVVRDSRTIRAYQGRNAGPEQTERFSRKVRIGNDGRVSVDNIAGNMTVTVGGGDEVSIEAVKRTRGPKSELADVYIRVSEGPGRVDIRTDHERNYRYRDGNGDHVSVDYTLTVPASAAVSLHSVSGDLRLTGARGTVRLDTVSDVAPSAATLRIEPARSTPGTVTLTGAAPEGDLTASSVSGNVVARSLKARGVTLNTISGSVNLTDVACDRLAVKT